MKKITCILSILLITAACDDPILDTEEANLTKVALEQNANLTAVNSQISSEAQRVLDYLEVVVESNKILSGQQVSGLRSNLYNPISEYQHIYDVVGKYPAVVGLDWLGRKNSNDLDADSLRNAKVQMAIEHWNQGGITTFAWHHEYPGNLNSGFDLVKRKTTQAEFDQIVTPGTPMYQVWLSEIDLIASYFKQLKNAGVPIIFRPYHEMNHGGFWYGDKSSSSYIQLWNNLYDRMVNYHGLNNLLWCWSLHFRSFASGYYPGDDKVDIVGVDMYKFDRDNPSYTSFDNKFSSMTTNPSALTEVGLLPTNEILNSTGYSWFMPWHSGWCDREFYGPPKGTLPGNSSTELLDIYSNPNVITLDEVNMDGSVATPIREEAEDLPVFDSAHPSVNANQNMSGGYYSFISTCVTDDFIEYTVNVPAGGVYPVQIGVSEGPMRAIWQLSIDGTDQGGAFDAYDPDFKVTDWAAGSRSFTAGEHTFRFTIVGKNSLATKWNIGFDFIKVGTTKFEAEQLNIFDSAFPSSKSNVNMSNGEYSFVGTCVLNDFIEYTIEVPSTANYSIRVGSSDGQVRAKWQCSIDGTDVGTPHDAYNSSFQVNEVNVGSKTLSAGEHKLRFTVVGKNPSASKWNIGFDYFELIPGVNQKAMLFIASV